MEKYSHPLIESIMKDSNNKFCFDCGIASPRWASVNNSVFLCLNCAGIHRGLGVGISFVRSLTMDNWDERQLSFLRNGGNRRLREFLEEYNIPLNTDTVLKYRLKAVDYYRKVIRAEILGSGIDIDRPDLISGLEEIDDGNKKEPSKKI
jgi:hypothetical protein